MKRLAYAWIALTLCSCAAGNVGRRAGTSGVEPDIRVLLAEGDVSYRVETSGGVVVEAGGLRLADTSEKGSVTIRWRSPSLNVEVTPGGQQIATSEDVTIRAKGNTTFTFGGVRYDGVIRATANPAGRLALLNVLPLERYLDGVLPHEMGNPGADGFDALRTQAIAARTYAIGKMEDRRSSYFDVYATVMDQVYRGVEGHTRLASGAISDTRGRIIEYEGETAKAYYCACCGGHTSDIRLVWPDRAPAEYLHGIRDGAAGTDQSFCHDHKYFRWRYSFSGKELGNVLRTTIAKERGMSAADVGAFEDIRIDKRSRSGRVIELTIVTTQGQFRFVGDRIRWVLMRDVSKGLILPSVLFRIDKVMEGDRVAFISISGGGNGHGVGMCQNGAVAMAKKGYTYEMILAHYYPGCTVVRRY